MQRGGALTQEWNALNQLTSRTDGIAANKTYFTYDGAGLLTAQIGAKGTAGGTTFKTTYQYNARRSLVNVTDAHNKTWNYEYDGNQNLTKITAPTVAAITASPQVVTISYDELNRSLTQTQVAGAGQTLVRTFAYDENSNLLSQTDPLGQRAEYTLDDLDRVKAINYVTTKTNGPRRYDFVRDGEGNVTDSVETLNQSNEAGSYLTRTFRRTYDERGRLATTTDSYGVTVRYGYDAANRMTSVSLAGGTTVTQSWLADGLLGQVSYAAGQTRSYAYDNADRVATITNTVGAKSERYGYAYDAHSNRTSETLTVDGATPALRTASYEYDFGERLTKATVGTQVTQWSYDGAGNRVSETLTGLLTGTKTYSYDSLNRLRGINGTSVTFDYDANGNLTTQRAGTSVTNYEYDARDQMRRVLNGAAEVAQYDYDYERRRIGKTLNQGISWQEYEYDGSRVLNEYQRTITADVAQRTASARYEYGIDLLRGTFGTTTPTSLWYYSDALGSVTALSNASGAIQTAYGYNAWGERTVGSDWGGVGSPLNNLNAIGYTGQFFDNETGLMPLGNGERYYAASLGRFTQQDSFSGVLGETASLNRYSYVHNNPTKYTDPSGHIIPLILAAVAVGALIGAATGAAIGGGGELIRQTAQKWDGTRTEYDWGQVGQAAGTGAVVGGLIGGLGAIPGAQGFVAVGVGALTAYGTYQGINSAADELSQGHYWTAAVDAALTIVGAVTGVRGARTHWNQRGTGTSPAMEAMKRWRGTGKTTTETVVESVQSVEASKVKSKQVYDEFIDDFQVNRSGEQPYTGRTAHRYPRSNPESQAALEVVFEALEEVVSTKHKKDGFAVGVFVHEDGTVTVGLSGTRKVGTIAPKLQEKLPEGWTVNTNVDITPQMINPKGMRAANIQGYDFQEGRTTCAECRLSLSSRNNPSPVTGMTVRQFGGKQPMAYTNSETREMAPCESCRINEDRIMEPVKVKEE